MPARYNPPTTDAPPPPPQPTLSWGAAPIERGIPNWIIRFIDWLNEKVGASKKKIAFGEQMATLEELFEGYEDDDAVGIPPEDLILSDYEPSKDDEHKKKKHIERLNQIVSNFQELMQQEFDKTVEKSKRDPRSHRVQQSIDEWVDECLNELPPPPPRPSNLPVGVIHPEQLGERPGDGRKRYS